MTAASLNGIYPDYFELNGYSSEDIDRRLSEIFETMFHGPEDERLYHEIKDMGYMVDTGNIDARTEGMSYGMMMCVQLDHKEEFDRIWKWARTYMYLEEGKNRGFFCWSNSLDGKKNSEGPAPDGEEYFALALLFASHRWGDGVGIFEYSREACDLLHSMIREAEGDRGRGMFDAGNHLIRFIPEADFTDPSYHLPHFYELFSKWAYPEDRTFYAKAASASREFLHRACHEKTGLCAEYSYYDGRPYEKGKEIWGRHDWYYSDAYRTVLNIALDHIWFCKDEWQETEGERFLTYMCENTKVSEEFAVPEWDGTLTEKSALHPVAVIATNAAAAALVSQKEGQCGLYAKQVIKRFWETPLRKGDRRYYDNCLYLFVFMLLSGRYRIW